MICFQDRTFCSAECGNKECGRRWTPELKSSADNWWRMAGGNDGEVPVAFSDFSGRCGAYMPAKTELEAAQ